MSADADPANKKQAEDRQAPDPSSIKARLAHPVQFEVTDWIPLLDGGLVITGWMVDPLECVLRIQITSGARSQYLGHQNSIWIPDPDVQRTLATVLGVTDRDCGFIAYIPGIHQPGDRIQATIETTLGNLPYELRSLQPRSELAAIKQLLGRFDLKYAELANAFDRVIGPAVEALNKARLFQRPPVREITFGTQPRSPKISVIIPLYARIDFLEHQLAQFSADAMEDIEFIYVLDDPIQRPAAEQLAEASYARFRIPIRLLSLDRNLGYGPASNIGAGHARAPYLCLLNSDVFPTAPNWLVSLTDTLIATPWAGIISPRLIYEDGCLQHDGCAYIEYPVLAGWHFVVHPGKGLLPPRASGPRRVLAVTGACMVMRRELFAALGGFDERYAIGDFEDSDLCQKVRQHGLECVVDDRVVLYHLERASQTSASDRWRANLTLYNAWQHERRWSRVPGAFG